MARLIALCGLSVVIVCLAGLAAAADKDAKDTEPEDPNHQQLRKLRTAIQDAVNEQRIDDLLEHVHPNVVAVWQNGEITRGHKGIRDYYNKHLGGPDATLKSYTIEPEVAELTILYDGKTGISWGTMTSHFVFKDGKTFDLKGPWSATLVKQDGRWLVAEFHASAPLFENPLVAAAQRALYWGCGIAAGVGLLVGALLVLLLKRRKAA
jgi:ketosteroid isomerase-like protein